MRYIECYWHREDPDGTPHHRVLPDGCVDILFTAQHGKPSSLSIVGLMTTPQVFDVNPGQSFFGVRFRPGMAAAFLPEAPQLNDRIEPLESLLDCDARLLFEQLAESSTFPQMARIMDTFLRPLKPFDSGQKVLEQLSIGADSMEQTAMATDLSPRQLRRLCLERAGVPPKYLSRILRFRKVVERINALRINSGQPQWADLAAACGYYDQAHFIREFQEFTNHTPGRYLQSLPDPDPYNRSHEPKRT
jgi:AraC-like DNA-binding protein